MTTGVSGTAAAIVGTTSVERNDDHLDDHDEGCDNNDDKRTKKKKTTVKKMRTYSKGTQFCTNLNMKEMCLHSLPDIQTHALSKEDYSSPA